jgi:hypothetical protein
MTQPPKISPFALQSAGMGMTLSTNSMSNGRATFKAEGEIGISALAVVDIRDNLWLKVHLSTQKRYKQMCKHYI